MTTLLPRVSTIKVNDIDLTEVDFVEDETGRILMSGLYASKHIPRAAPYRGLEDWLQGLIKGTPIVLGLQPTSWLATFAPVFTGRNGNVRFLSEIAFDSLLQAQSDKLLTECRSEFINQYRHYERVRDERDARPEPGTGIIPRDLDGLPVAQREVDGYVNITAFLAAFSERGILKQWSAYTASRTNQEFMASLADSLGCSIETEIPRNGIQLLGLYEQKQGGRPEDRGTYAHPRLAIDVARWADPKLAVIMNGWVDDWMRKGKEPNFGGFNMPKDFPEALEALAKTERLRIASEKKLEEAQPAIRIHRLLKSKPGDVEWRPACIRLQQSESHMRHLLIEVWQWCMKSNGTTGRTIPRADYRSERAGVKVKYPYLAVRQVEITDKETEKVSTHPVMVFTTEGFLAAADMLGVEPLDEGDPKCV